MDFLARKVPAMSASRNSLGFNFGRKTPVLAILVAKAKFRLKCIGAKIFASASLIFDNEFARLQI